MTGEERIRKRILLTLQDGSMYGFDFDFITRKTYSQYALRADNNIPFAHYALSKKGVYKRTEPNDGMHVEIQLVGGLTNYHDLMKNQHTEYPRIFLITAGESYDNYIAYPTLYQKFMPLTHIEQAHNVIKNWAINFVDYYLAGDGYSQTKAVKYLRYWYRSNALNRIKVKNNIEKIEFTFRTKN